MQYKLQSVFVLALFTIIVLVNKRCIFHGLDHEKYSVYDVRTKQPIEGSTFETNIYVRESDDDWEETINIKTGPDGKIKFDIDHCNYSGPYYLGKPGY